MWMMGYNDGGDFNMPDSFTGRKLRPLMPRPHPNNSTTLNNPTNCLRAGIHGSEFIPLHHQIAMAEPNKRDFNTQQLVVSSRWNPTPEQLQTLEELYRRGTRTPSADQIQHITAQLRRYGKIEGKNVFYWFQNHKARERQKRRRQLESSTGGCDEQPHNNNFVNGENMERNKELGSNRTCFELEQTKNWPSPTNCSNLPQKSVGANNTRASKAAVVAERRTEGWIPFDDVSERRNLLERNATWQMMHLSCSPPPTHLINNSSTHIPIPTSSCSVTATTTTPLISCSTSPATTPTTMDPKRPFKPKDNHLNIFLTPFKEDHVHNQYWLRTVNDNDNGDSDQTLQLFPLRSCNDEDKDDMNRIEKETEISDAANFSSFSHLQFFEFLPLKN